MVEPVLLPRPRRLVLLDGVHRPGPEPEVIVDPIAVPRPEGYRLLVEAGRVSIVAHDAAGAQHLQAGLEEAAEHGLGVHQVLGAAERDESDAHGGLGWRRFAHKAPNLRKATKPWQLRFA